METNGRWLLGSFLEGLIMQWRIIGMWSWQGSTESSHVLIGEGKPPLLLRFFPRGWRWWTLAMHVVNQPLVALKMNLPQHQVSRSIPLQAGFFQGHSPDLAHLSNISPLNSSRVCFLGLFCTVVGMVILSLLWLWYIDLACKSFIFMIARMDASSYFVSLDWLMLYRLHISLSPFILCLCLFSWIFHCCVFPRWICVVLLNGSVAGFLIPFLVGLFKYYFLSSPLGLIHWIFFMGFSYFFSLSGCWVLFSIKFLFLIISWVLFCLMLNGMPYCFLFHC